MLDGHLHVVLSDLLGGEERGLTFTFACLLSCVPCWPSPAACGHSQGVTLPAASRMQQVRFLRHVVGDVREQPRPAAYFTPRRARGCAACSSVCVRIGCNPRAYLDPRDSHVRAVHDPQQPLTSLTREVLCSQVRRVRLGDDLLHCELPAERRVLEPRMQNLDVLRFAQPCSAYKRQCRTGVDVQPNVALRRSLAYA